MPYTTPPNFVAGTPLSEGDLDTLSDDITFLAYRPSVSVFNSATVSIPNDAETPLAFDSEDFDTDSMHSTATNTSRLTVATAGKFVFTATVMMVANATGLRYCYIKKNGTTYVARTEVTAPHATRDSVFNPSTAPISMSVGDYVEVVMYQNSGAPLNVVANSLFGGYQVSL